MRPSLRRSPIEGRADGAAITPPAVDVLWVFAIAGDCWRSTMPIAQFFPKRGAVKQGRAARRVIEIVSTACGNMATCRCTLAEAALKRLSSC
jgi:hypothetical protein